MTEIKFLPWDSNPQPLDRQLCVLPLSYHHSLKRRDLNKIIVGIQTDFDTMAINGRRSGAICLRSE